MNAKENSQSPNSKLRRAILFTGTRESAKLLPPQVLAIPNALQSLSFASERSPNSAYHIDCSDGIVVFVPEQNRSVANSREWKNANFDFNEPFPPIEKRLEEGVLLLANRIIENYKKRNPRKYRDLRLDLIYGLSGFNRREFFSLDYSDERKLSQWGIFSLKYGDEASGEKNLILLSQGGAISTLRPGEGLGGETYVQDRVFVSPEIVLISYLNLENGGMRHCLYDVRERGGGQIFGQLFNERNLGLTKVADNKYILGLNPVFNSRRTGISYVSIKNFPPVPPKIITLGKSTAENNILDVSLGDEPIVNNDEIDLPGVGDKFLANFFPVPGSGILKVNLERKLFSNRKGDDASGNFLQFEMIGMEEVDLAKINNKLLGDLETRGYYNFRQIPSLGSCGNENRFFAGLFFHQGKAMIPRLVVLDIKKVSGNYVASHKIVEVVDDEIIGIVSRRDRLYLGEDDNGNIIISVKTAKLNQPYYYQMAIYNPKKEELNLVENVAVAL